MSQTQHQQQKGVVDSNNNGNNILSNTPSNGNNSYLTLDGVTHNLTPYIQQVDMLLPQLTHAQREQLIFRFEQFYFSKYLKDPSPIPNLVFLIRNTNQHRNPYIQHFLLEQHGDVVTLENCIFPIPATPTHASVAKPLVFFVNLYPEVMLHFLQKRPELVQCIDPSTNQSILHQYELDHRLLLWCYSQRPSLINHLDKNHRCPLHHRNQPHAFISLALTQNPNLYDLEDSHGNTVRSLLTMKHFDPNEQLNNNNNNDPNIIDSGGRVLGTNLPSRRSNNNNRRNNIRSPYDGNNNNNHIYNNNNNNPNNILSHHNNHINNIDGNNHFHHHHHGTTTTNNNNNQQQQQQHHNRRRGGNIDGGNHYNRNNNNNSPYDGHNHHHMINNNNNNFGNHNHNTNHHGFNNNNNNHHHHHHHNNNNNNMNTIPTSTTPSSSTNPSTQQQQQSFHTNNTTATTTTSGTQPIQHIAHLAAQHHYQPQYHPTQIVLPQ
eukprot:UN00261